jgi:hypothetical protein
MWFCTTLVATNMMCSLFKKFVAVSLLVLLLFLPAFLISSEPALASQASQKSIQIQKSERTGHFPVEKEDAVAMVAIGTASAAAAQTFGAITVLTSTTTTVAPLLGLQILGSLGLAATSVATTVIALPAAGIVATSGLAVYGGYKVYQHLRPVTPNLVQGEKLPEENKVKPLSSAVHKVAKAAKAVRDIKSLITE